MLQCQNAWTGQEEIRPRSATINNLYFNEKYQMGNNRQFT